MIALRSWVTVATPTPDMARPWALVPPAGAQSTSWALMPKTPAQPRSPMLNVTSLPLAHAVSLLAARDESMARPYRGDELGVSKSTFYVVNLGVYGELKSLLCQQFGSYQVKLTMQDPDPCVQWKITPVLWSTEDQTYKAVFTICQQSDSGSIMCLLNRNGDIGMTRKCAPTDADYIEGHCIWDWDDQKRSLTSFSRGEVHDPLKTADNDGGTLAWDRIENKLAIRGGNGRGKMSECNKESQECVWLLCIENKQTCYLGQKIKGETQKCYCDGLIDKRAGTVKPVLPPPTVVQERDELEVEKEACVIVSGATGQASMVNGAYYWQESTNRYEKKDDPLARLFKMEEPISRENLEDGEIPDCRDRYGDGEAGRVAERFDPKTGVSKRCVELRDQGLCNDPQHRDNCKMTCGRCPGSDPCIDHQGELDDDGYEIDDVGGTLSQDGLGGTKDKPVVGKEGLIVTEEECEEHAETIGVEFRTARKSNGAPKGCVYYHGHPPKENDMPRVIWIETDDGKPSSSSNVELFKKLRRHWTVDKADCSNYPVDKLGDMRMADCTDVTWKFVVRPAEAGKVVGVKVLYKTDSAKGYRRGGPDVEQTFTIEVGGRPVLQVKNTQGQGCDNDAQEAPCTKEERGLDIQLDEGNTVSVVARSAIPIMHVHMKMIGVTLMYGNPYQCNGCCIVGVDYGKATNPSCVNRKKPTPRCAQYMKEGKCTIKKEDRQQKFPWGELCPRTCGRCTSGHLNPVIIHHNGACSMKAADLGTGFKTPAECAEAAEKEPKCKQRKQKLTIMWPPGRQNELGCSCCAPGAHYAEWKSKAPTFTAHADRLPYQEAKEACEKNGQVLAMVKSEADRDALSAVMLASNVADAWIGMTNVNKCTYDWLNAFYMEKRRCAIDPSNDKSGVKLSQDGMSRLAAQAHCEKMPACKGLMYNRKGGQDGRTAEFGFYQSCEGRSQADDNWDIIIKPRCKGSGGTWKWTDGTDVEGNDKNPFWKPGDPNQDGECGQQNSQRNDWCDKDCKFKEPFVCSNQNRLEKQPRLPGEPSSEAKPNADEGFQGCLAWPWPSTGPIVTTSSPQMGLEQCKQNAIKAGAVWYGVHHSKNCDYGNSIPPVRGAPQKTSESSSSCTGVNKAIFYLPNKPYSEPFEEDPTWQVLEVPAGEKDRKTFAKSLRFGWGIGYEGHHRYITYDPGRSKFGLPRDERNERWKRRCLKADPCECTWWTRTYKADGDPPNVTCGLCPK